MIVKKMPVLQGFPSVETVKYLTEKQIDIAHNSPVFYDIETTGLSQNSSFVYLIGAISKEKEHWILHQWMCENQTEEAELLQTFSHFLSSDTYTIQYNGNHFDQPYLEARMKKYQIASPFFKRPSLDLYLELKPLKNMLKLTKMKQPYLEEFLQIGQRSYCDGRECIKHYLAYEKRKSPALQNIILGHSEEDLLGLLQIFKMLSYLLLAEGAYQIQECVIQEQYVTFALLLPVELPAEFSNGTDEFYITGQKKVVKLLLKPKDKRIKLYYPDYKNYDYLLQEDCVIPKSIGKYMDKSLRVPAKADTCYTWLDCTGEFFEDPKIQQNYLHHTLPVLLKMLK